MYHSISLLQAPTKFYITKANLNSNKCYSATAEHANNLLDRRERDLNAVRIAHLTTLPTASCPKCQIKYMQLCWKTYIHALFVKA